MFTHLGNAVGIPHQRNIGIQHYFLKSTFQTDDAAPVADPYAGEIGSVDINDTTNDLSVSVGRMTSAGGSVGSSNPGASGSLALTRQNGLLYVADVKQVQVGTDGVREISPAIGFETSLQVSALGSMGGLAFNSVASAGYLFIPFSSSTPNTYVAPTPTVDVRFAFLCSGSLLYVIAGTKVVGVIESVSASSLYPFVKDLATNRYSFDVAYMAAGLLRGQYAQDNALRTLAIANPTNGQAFTHPANFWMWVTLTAPSSGNLDIVFRKQDANNKWILRVNSAGALAVIEVIAGVENSRTSSAGGYITTATRIMMVADGVRIVPYKTYTQGPIYSSASNFQSATGGDIALGTGGVVTDLHIHYRDIPASLQAEINAS